MSGFLLLIGEIPDDVCLAFLFLGPARLDMHEWVLRLDVYLVHLLAQQERLDLGLLLLQLSLHGPGLRDGLLLLQLTDNAAALQLASLPLNQCGDGFQCFLIELEGLGTKELALILFLRASRRTIAWCEDEVILVEVSNQDQVEVLVSFTKE